MQNLKSTTKNVFQHYHWKSIITEKANTPQNSAMYYF